MCVSEVLLTMVPCFVFLADSPDPFFCFVLVGTYVDQVGFFHEVRHIPVVLVGSLGIVVWWAMRENRRRDKAPSVGG